ncbi:MAG: MCE family protein [Rhizobiaceae bacterium]|nr:MCE family protein [Rhizobiaceae bacterium]
METRANYVAVGLFTLLAIVAGFVFLYWTSGAADRTETVTLRVRIPGSASGLGRGSAVLFNGVKVGDVRRVYIDVSNPSAAIAETSVDRLTPITQSTRAEIGLAGLTGQANIEIKGGSVEEPNLLRQAEEAGTVAEIIANPSPVTNLLQTAQSILTRADKVMTDLEGFTGESRQPISETLKNIERFSQALGRNADGVDSLLANVGKLSETLGAVSGSLGPALDAAEGLLKSVDPAKITSIVGNVEDITREFRDSTVDLDTVMGEVRTAAASFASFSTEANAAIGKLSKMLEGIDAASISGAIENFEQTSGDIRKAVADVTKVTERIGARAGDVDQMVTDAQQLASRLNQASVRIGGVMEKVEALLGSESADSLIANAGETFASFRKVADTLNGRIGPITEGLARFSGQGLRDMEALIQDGRRAIQRIEAAISSIERNPQRLLTGGDGPVREFDGARNRR